MITKDEARNQIAETINIVSKLITIKKHYVSQCFSGNYGIFIETDKKPEVDVPREVNGIRVVYRYPQPESEDESI